MKENDIKVFLASLKNTTKKLEVLGNADITEINLLKMIYKYVGYSEKYSQIQMFDSMVAKLQRESKDICNQMTALKQYPDGLHPPVNISVDGSSSNNNPTISDSSFILLEADLSYTFTNSEFYVDYNDVEGDSAGDIVIKTLPLVGTLTYDGNPVSAGDQISDATLLVYTRFEEDAYSTSFTFTVFDTNSQIPLESNIATMNGTIEAYVEVIDNESPTVGDRDKYAGNRVTTVFTSADFTTEAILPYDDPENDPLQAILIIEIAESNDGTFYYLGSPLTVNQVITKAELDSGALYHIGADTNAINTDSFRCAVRDCETCNWVE